MADLWWEDQEAKLMVRVRDCSWWSGGPIAQIYAAALLSAFPRVALAAVAATTSKNGVN